MTLEPCTHHGHASAAQSRLCRAVRDARPLVRPWSRDGRHAALLAAVVRAHELDARGTAAEQDRQAQTLEALMAPPTVARPIFDVAPEPVCAPAAPPIVVPAEPTPVLPAVVGPALLVAYTDGSGTQAHLPCGAGVVVYDGTEAILEASRHLGLGTNNHAELSAVRIALAITDAPSLRDRDLVVRSDSMYAIGALTAPELPGPERPNARLIHAVRALLEGRRVRFVHVKGHSGVAGNERADKLAGLGRLRAPATVTSAAEAAP